MGRKKLPRAKRKTRQVALCCDDDMMGDLQLWAERERVPVQFLVRRIMEDALAAESKRHVPLSETPPSPSA